MEVKLKKEDEDFIKSLEDSSFSDDSKKRLINMIKANRVMMDMILDELDLTKHNSSSKKDCSICDDCLDYNICKSTAKGKKEYCKFKRSPS